MKGLLKNTEVLRQIRYHREFIIQQFFECELTEESYGSHEVKML